VEAWTATAPPAGEEQRDQNDWGIKDKAEWQKRKEKGTPRKKLGP